VGTQVCDAERRGWLLAGRDAERPNVRSYAERGNEEIRNPSTHSCGTPRQPSFEENPSTTATMIGTGAKNEWQDDVFTRQFDKYT
jgi:hypothetical protein